MGFEWKLSVIRLGDRKSYKQKREIEKITNLYDARD